MRARSNSAESWVAALGDDRSQEGAKRISRQDAVVAERNKAKGRIISISGAGLNSRSC